MSDDRTTELLPCPFCGGDDLSEGPYSPYVICNGCGAFGPGNSDVTHEEAIEAWNTRTSEQAIAATLGGVECVPHGEWESISQTQEVRHIFCECGHELGMDRRDSLPFHRTSLCAIPNYCEECGRKIRKAVKR